MSIHNSTVSIVIPTHNRVHLLERALNSALSQTYKEIEIIVVNDGSTDDSIIYLDNLTDPRLKVIHIPEARGACNARNIGIKNASGTYITFLDDDDEYLPTRIEELIHAYRTEFAYAASAHYYIHQNGRTEIINFGKNISIDDMLTRIVTGNTILTETSKVRSLGGFDTNLASSQDYDLWLRLNLEYGSGVYVTKPLFIMHTEHEKPRITLSNKKFNGHWQFYQKHKVHFSKRQRAYQLFELLRCQRKKVSLKKAILLTYRTSLTRGVRHYLAVTTPRLRDTYMKITSNKLS